MEPGGRELRVVWPQTEALMSRCSWTWYQGAARISSRRRKTEALAKARLTTAGCTAMPLSCRHRVTEKGEGPSAAGETHLKFAPAAAGRPGFVSPRLGGRSCLLKRGGGERGKMELERTRYK